MFHGPNIHANTTIWLFVYGGPMAAVLGGPMLSWLPISPHRVDSSKGPHRVNRAHWPTKENRQLLHMFLNVSVHGKIAPGGCFPTNPDLADILGDTDFDFENLDFLFFGSQISGLGPAWAHPLGPGLGPPTWARHGPTHLGPAWAHPLGPLGRAGGPLGWARVGPRVGSAQNL